MDNTIIQEASASETMNGDATPECAADIPSDAAAATTDAAPAATETKSYDDLFPSLPTSGRNPAAGGPTNNAWNRKPVLASSTVTQVRYVNTMYCTCHVASNAAALRANEVGFQLRARVATVAKDPKCS